MINLNLLQPIGSRAGLFVVRIAAIFLLGLALGAIVAVAFRTAWAWNDGQRAASGRSEARPSSEPNSGLSQRRAIVALGTLEPRDGIIQLSSPLVGCQIVTVLVQEGNPVKADQPLIQLDASAASSERELAAAQLDEAAERQAAEITLGRQRVASAELALKQAGEGSKLELDLQRSRLALTAARQDQAAKDLGRVEGMRKLAEPLATEQQVEQQRVLLQAAQAEHEAAQTALKRLEQSLAFDEQKGQGELRAARESLAIAEKGTGLATLKRRLELADLKLRQTKVLAPTDGVVLAVLAHLGEVVAQQPLVQMADLDHLVCSAEVDSSDVPYLSPRNPAKLTCRAFRDAALSGTIERVGNQISQPTLRPLDPRRSIERDVIKVIVAVDAAQAASLMGGGDSDRRAALVGLQVEAAFELGKTP